MEVTVQAQLMGDSLHWRAYATEDMDPRNLIMHLVMVWETDHWDEREFFCEEGWEEEVEQVYDAALEKTPNYTKYVSHYYSVASAEVN